MKKLQTEYRTKYIRFIRVLCKNYNKTREFCFQSGKYKSKNTLNI